MNNEKTVRASSRIILALSNSRRTLGWRGESIGAWLARAALFLLCALSLNALGASQETFATLKIGDRTYQNVTVTTKGKNFIIISHTGGIASIKVSELPTEALQKLGYAPAPKPKKHTKEGPLLASLAIPKLDLVSVKPFKAKLSQLWDRACKSWDKSRVASKIQQLKHDRRALTVAAVVLLTAYLFYSYCCMLICQKTGYNPGLWVFVPVVQAFPMLRAASMSAWWFVAFLIPIANLVGYVVWCLKIVNARQKTRPLAILLIFPLTSWFAFLFLAFSEASAPEGSEVAVEVMAPQSVLTA